MGRKRGFSQAAVLEAIHGSSGFISSIAKRLNCDWHTAKTYVDKWEKTQQALADEEETTLDFVEGKAIERIKTGDGPMIRFYLATKGRKRGFITDDKQLPEDFQQQDKEVKLVIEDRRTECSTDTTEKT